MAAGDTGLVLGLEPGCEQNTQPPNDPATGAQRRAGTGQTDSAGLLGIFSENLLVGLSRRKVLGGARRLKPAWWLEERARGPMRGAGDYGPGCLRSSGLRLRAERAGFRQ